MINVIGLTDLKFMTSYIATNVAPFIHSSYYVIDEKLTSKKIPCEVIETTILPCTDRDLLPVGISVKSVEKAGMDINKPLFIAKVKILKNLAQPIMPGSVVSPAKYEEISGIITNADPRDSMILGVIKGTEVIQDQLPDTLSNVAPLWKNGKAVAQEGVPLMLNYRGFREYPNIGIFGGAGSGKSFALKTICEELMKLGIPALIFDPHSELKFEGTMDGLDDKFKFDFTTRYNEFHIGENVGIKFTDLSFSELSSLFNFVGGLTDPQKNALEVLYEQRDSIEYLADKINALKEAIDIMETDKNKNKYGKGQEPVLADSLQNELYYKCKNKVSGSATLQALGWKFNSLISTNVFTCDTDSVKDTLSIGKVAIIRGDISRLQMISSYLLSKMYLTRRNYVENEKNTKFFPPFFTIMDEAHNFAPLEGHSATKSILRKIAQEARKFGVFLILCTQRPKILDTTIVAQLSTKFIFRLTDQSDLDVAKTEGNLTDSQVATLPELKSGNCFATSALLNKTYPVLFRTTYTKAGSAKDPFKEMEEQLSKGDNNDIIVASIMECLPFNTATLTRVCTSVAKSQGSPMPIVLLKEKIKELESKGIIKAEKTGMTVNYTLNIKN